MRYIVSQKLLRQVVAMMAKNLVGGREVTAGEVEAIKGKWDDEARSFVPSDDSPNAVRVVASLDDRPLFFGAILGEDTFGVHSDAIATFQPRDVLVVLPFVLALVIIQLSIRMPW